MVEVSISFCFPSFKRGHIPDEEGYFAAMVKSIMYFREREVQWDAGVCQGKV